MIVIRFMLIIILFSTPLYAASSSWGGIAEGINQGIQNAQRMEEIRLMQEQRRMLEQQRIMMEQEQQRMLEQQRLMREEEQKRAEQQRLMREEEQKRAEHERFIDKIRIAHPDFEKYLNDGTLEAWIQKQPDNLRDSLLKVYKGGDADASIALLTQFKKENSIHNFSKSDHTLAPSQVFDKVKDTILVVKTLDAKGKAKSQGSGVLLPSGKVATNCHVVEGGVSYRVGRGERFVPATLYTKYGDKDICLLDAKGITGEPAQIGRTTDLKVGDAVYAVGAPKGLELSLSDGIVSQLRGGPPPFIQTTAAISPGSSGGGLFDSEGKLVGLTTLYVEGGQNLNFAMPVEWIAEVKPGSEAVAMAKRPSVSVAGETSRDGRFIAYNNGTVLDTQTNLMWASKDNGGDINWANAKSYCENYRGGGYSDWRMPTQDELEGLYDAEKSQKVECGNSPNHVATDLIHLSCSWVWGLEMRGSASAGIHFGSGGRHFGYNLFDARNRALPVRYEK
jgi:S1-C subfamily serine protease